MYASTKDLSQNIYLSFLDASDNVDVRKHPAHHFEIRQQNRK